MLGAPSLEVAKLFEMLPGDAGDSAAGRTPADNETVRTVYDIGPDKLIKAMLSYPMTTGRNFDEVLCVIDSLQLTVKHKVATPVNWKQGDDVIIAGSVSDEEARKNLPARLEGAQALHSHRAATQVNGTGPRIDAPRRRHTASTNTEGGS